MHKIIMFGILKTFETEGLKVMCEGQILLFIRSSASLNLTLRVCVRNKGVPGGEREVKRTRGPIKVNVSRHTAKVR